MSLHSLSENEISKTVGVPINNVQSKLISNLVVICQIIIMDKDY